MNHENTQNSTIVIDGLCASNDPEESQTTDQNNMDIEITATTKKLSTPTQTLTAKPNNERTILIIGDSIIKHIDPRKISKRRVIKRTFPGKTANDIKAEIKSIKVDSPHSHIIVHAGTNDIPVDLDNNPPRFQALLRGRKDLGRSWSRGSHILGAKLKLYLGRGGRGLRLLRLENYNFCVIVSGDKI